MKQRKYIVDTTLRDGEQCPGVVFQEEDKVRLALLLDDLGVYEIEVGYVDLNVKDQEYVSKIMNLRKKAKISLWCRMRLDDVEAACQLHPDLIHIGVPVSYVQIYTKLKKNKVWVQNQITSCIKIADRYQIPVTVGLEDSTRADIGFMLSLVKHLYSLGVTTVRVADTVGTITPDRGAEIVKQILEVVREMKVEIHEHNDLGMAVANSIVMANAGGDYIDCTILGIGERVGNCNFYDFVKASDQIFDFGIDKHKIPQLEQELIHILSKGMEETRL